jgi:ABC-type nitrate/sulfonate/bicarbonate transport system permease component
MAKGHRAIARRRLVGPSNHQTLGTYVLGLGVATVIGAAVGVAIGASRRVDFALTPSIDFAAAIPGAALVPVAVLLLGPSPISGVAAVALIVSWPILLNAAMTLRVGRKGDLWIPEERRPRAGR